MLRSLSTRMSRGVGGTRTNAVVTIIQRCLFIQTESTPNPESIKFLPGRVVLGNEDSSGFYVTQSDRKEIAKSPLAKSLFEIEGVKSVYLGSDFVTITKYAANHWKHLRVEVFEAIMDFYATGQPAVRDAPEITDTTILDDDDEVVAMIKELLETRIRPAVQEDGGDIRYVNFDEETGVVSVKLAGSCVGCPSSSVTLKNGVENMLMHYIPEITAVNAVEDPAEEDHDAAVDSSASDGTTTIDDKETTETQKKQQTYEERLKAAGIPFSD